jgi:hypothetical protein
MTLLNTAYPYITAFFELAALIATPVVAIIAYRALRQVEVGLQQIEVSKEISKTQSQRESFKISAEKCDYFAESVIPKINSFFKSKEAGKYPNLMSIEVEETKGSFGIKTKKMKEAFTEISNDEGLVLELSNMIEGFSMYYTCGIADESIAFRPISSVYCKTVAAILPILIFSNNRNKTYSHTLGLYQTWNNRIKKEKAELDLQAAQKKVSEIKTRKIKTIGT